MSRTSTASSSPSDPADGPGPVPESPEAIAAALAELGVAPRRALGQSFLTDPFVADALAAVARPTSGEPVFEVGGGLGIVTAALLRRGIGELTVIERDPRLARGLERTFRGSVRVETADALEFDFPDDAVVVGSLPYSVATPLLLRLIHRRVPRVAAIVQREVAERFGAAPGTHAYGRPTILAALFGSVELLRVIPASAFYPRPKVTSRLLAYHGRAGALAVGSVERLEHAVRTVFSARRKQLGNVLPRLVGSRGAAEELARDADWPSTWAHLRPESLPPEAYFRLERALARRGNA